jgi:leucyl-tRNA synthetase
VKIHGRLRSRLVVSAAAGNEELQNSALADARVRKHIGDSVVKKVIVVPKKLINIVVSK